MSAATLTETSPGVVQLTIDNEKKRNALDLNLCDSLVSAVTEIARDSTIRAVVVTGAGGRAFCAGADLPDIFGDLPNDIADIRLRLKRVYRGFLGLRALSVPVIAAVRGPAVGAGLNIALCCDVVLTAADASFAVTFTHLGLHPGGGCTYFLVESIGRQRAMRLILEGGRLTGTQAVQWGLAASVEEDPLQAAHTLARRVADLDFHLVSDIKSAVRLADTGDIDATVEFESWAQAASTRSEQLRAAVAAFRQ
jgi:enoyl-CoA hydratase